MVAAICLLGVSTTLTGFVISKFIYGMTLLAAIGMAYIVGAIVVTMAFGLALTIAYHRVPDAVSMKEQRS